MAQFLDNTFANDMVWQAAEWLCTNDVRCTVVDQFHHFTRQEPSFTGLIADGNNWFCVFRQITNVGRRVKAFAGL